VHLERKAMELLVLLVQRAGQLVTRGEIVDALWGEGVFVDVENGIHTAVRKVRRALNEEVEGPDFLETVPGKGYRFSAIVESLIEPDGHAGTTLAVLPFVHLGDPEREYLADGLTEDTIGTLGQIDPVRLRLIGRTSMMSYKGSDKTLAVIGRELEADYLLEGSVRGEDEHVRVTASLIRVRDQVQVWSVSYDRHITSVLALQRELSMAIAEQIRLWLSPERLEAIVRRQTHNADAYDLYLRGLNFAHQRTRPTTERAMDYFRGAIALDPAYALAWSGLADAFSASSINGDARPLDVGPRALDAATHAIDANPDLAQAQFALGFVHWSFTWDWLAAEAAFRRAVDLDPLWPFAHWMLGHALSQMGHHAEAASAMLRARQLDPLSAMVHAISSQVAFQARDHSAALEYAHRAIVIDPQFWIGYVMRAQAYEHLGEVDLAMDDLVPAARFSGGNSKAISFKGHLCARVGQTDAARDVLKMLHTAARERYVPPFAIALVHAGLREDNAVFEWLERALASRDVHMVFLTVDSRWDRYRADPRFTSLIARCGFAVSGDTQHAGPPAASALNPDSVGRSRRRAVRRRPTSASGAASTPVRFFDSHQEHETPNKPRRKNGIG
jgi:TolB-like protein/Tfp pilus assembly protein PilF